MAVSNPLIHDDELVYPLLRQTSSQPNIRTSSRDRMQGRGIQDDWLLPRGMIRVQATHRDISYTPTTIATTANVEAPPVATSTPIGINRTNNNLNQENEPASEQISAKESPRPNSISADYCSLTEENEQVPVNIFPDAKEQTSPEKSPRAMHTGPNYNSLIRKDEPININIFPSLKKQTYPQNISKSERK